MCLRLVVPSLDICPGTESILLSSETTRLGFAFQCQADHLFRILRLEGLYLHTISDT